MTTEKLNPENARQGEKSGHMRYVLIGSVIGAVVALVIVGLFF
ncbi:hypothetical protein [Minwuia sp.]